MKKLSIYITILFFVANISTSLRAQVCYTCPNQGNNVTGSASSAFGTNNTVSGMMSTAIGNNNSITTGASFIAGTYSNIYSSSGNSVIVGGSNTIINGCSESYIFGSGSQVIHTRAMLIGHRLQSGAASQIILGAGRVGGFLTNNKMYSLAIGFNSNVPTFFVGESPANDQTGRVGIGNNTEPQAKLHVKADKAEDATLFLEATGTDKISSVFLGGGQAVIGTTSNNYSLSFVTGSINTRMFINGLDGYVGIGTEKPKSKLHVEGNSFFRDQMVIGTPTLPATLDLFGTMSVSSLQSLKGNRLVAADENGRLLTIEYSEIPGDNLGNHIATQNLSLGEFGLTYNQVNEAGLTLTKTNDIYIAKNLAVNENVVVKGGIYGYAPAAIENWSKLQIFGSTLPDAAKIEVCDGSGDDWRSIKFSTQGNTADYQFYIDSKMAMRIRSNKVELGSDAIPTALNVYGIINAREVKVSIGSWSDYVFEPGYKLRDLCEVEDFILNYGHLPDIPPALTVIENGVNLGEMDALLLKKIEELTLYVIEQQKEIKALKEVVLSNK